MDLRKQTDSNIALKTVALKKLAILEEEKHFWSLQRQKGKDTAKRVIERVREVVQDGILELEGKQLDLVNNPNNDPTINIVAEEAKDEEPGNNINAPQVSWF